MTKCVFTFTKKKKTKRALTESKFIWSCLFIFVGFIFLKNGMPSLSSLSFYNISETRAEYTSSLPIAILQNLTCKILLPLIISDTLEKKRWLPFGLAVVFQVYIYSVTGFKTFLLIPLLIIATKLVKIRDFRKLLLFGMFAGFFLALITHYIIDNVMLSAVVFNRFIFLPAKIKEAYFDFFSKNEFVYFTQSSIASILGIESNYTQNVVYLIGDKYFNKPEMWTNTGFLADGYANLGIIGGLIVSLLLSVELTLLNKAIKVPSKHSATVVFLLFYIALNDGAIISVSISGVFLPAILLIYFTRAGERK